MNEFYRCNILAWAKSERMNARTAINRLEQLADADTARVARGFMKTGPGEYGEGDVFIGVKAEPLRRLAREFEQLPLLEIAKLLESPVHESRSLALLILVRAFGKADPAGRRDIHHFYLRNTARVNSWDLVDVSAEHLVGGFLAEGKRGLLDRLARSKSLWERRIAIVATYYFIKREEFADTQRIAALLRDDQEDLIHKAVGWMLREMGKRDVGALEGYLAEHYRHMPRTMLRYAIERFSQERRQQYLKGEV
jgi:3-methyladenine DNA glycosylase AlkD